MIPEESFNFNGCSPSGNFDHPEVRWPHLLQQDAVSALEAGRHLLAVCPICKQPWYKAGRQEYPRLTPVQLAFVGALLQVDIQALYLLPRAICTICSALHLGGMFSAEIYPHDGGYRFLWESVSPRRLLWRYAMWMTGLFLLLALVFLAAAARGGLTCRERAQFFGLALLSACACVVSLSLWHP